MTAIKVGSSLIGGLFGKKKKKKTETNAPWSAAQPYLKDGMQSMQDAYRADAASTPFPGTGVAGINPTIQQARAAQSDYLGGGAADNWINEQQSAAGGLLNGGYYSPVQDRFRGLSLNGQQLASTGAQGASAGNVGVNYRPAAEDILSGRVDSPYLQQYVQGMLDQSGREFSENTMSALRSGGIGAGQRSSSRQGIAEGLASARFGTGLLDTANKFYSDAYDAAQGRRSDMVQSLSGQDTQRAISTAGNQTSAAIQSANNRLSGLQGNQSAGMQAQDLSLKGQVSNQNAAAESGRLALGGLDAAPGIFGQRMTAYSALEDVGNRYRQDEQGLLSAAQQRWDSERDRALNNSTKYYTALAGNTPQTSTTPKTGGGPMGVIGGATSALGGVSKLLDGFGFGKKSGITNIDGPYRGPW